MSSFSALLSSVQRAINAMGIIVPTKVQDFAIPQLMARKNLLLISQTGKGKTLAFLAPVVDQLLRDNSDSVFPIPHKPRAIVLVPTRELATQTLGVVTGLFGHLVTAGALAPGCLSFVKERRMLSAGVDLLVATPSRLRVHLERKSAGLGEVRFCVVDEIDALCEEELEVQKLIKQIAKRGACIALVGATQTVAVSEFVDTAGIKSISISKDEMKHVLPSSLRQNFVPLGRRKRTDCLLDILQGGGRKLVFVNSVSTCDFVVRRMKDHFPLVLALHGSLPRNVRKRNFSKFQKSPENAILVSTNLASRGLDLGRVDHVIMYELPDVVADYLHRAGRTARAGATGRVTSLVAARDAPLLKELQQMK